MSHGCKHLHLGIEARKIWKTLQQASDLEKKKMPRTIDMCAINVNDVSIKVYMLRNPHRNGVSSRRLSESPTLRSEMGQPFFVGNTALPISSNIYRCKCCCLCGHHVLYWLADSSTQIFVLNEPMLMVMVKTANTMVAVKYQVSYGSNQFGNYTMYEQTVVWPAR